MCLEKSIKCANPVNSLPHKGTEEQKNYLPGLAIKLMGRFCLPEVVPSSDVFSLKAQTKRKVTILASVNQRCGLVLLKEAFFVIANANSSTG